MDDGWHTKCKIVSGIEIRLYVSCLPISIGYCKFANKLYLINQIVFLTLSFRVRKKNYCKSSLKMYCFTTL